MADTPSGARRLAQFLHPGTGHTVHVASSPEAAETLRRTLSQSHGDDTFDLYIKGSDEHIRAIEEARAHHERERDELKRTYTDVYERFQNVHNELDLLSAELSTLTNQGVSLDANFDRFGYSAHIRTVEDDAGSVSALSRASTTRSREGERPMGESLPLFKRPVIRQYFHKGLMWRASSNTEVSSIELFFDLLYVGIIAVIGDRAAKDPTGESLLKFSITFILSWKLWTDLTTIISWINLNDIFQRLCILLFMAFLVGYTVNIENAFDSTYTELIAFYVGERVYTAAYFILLAYLIPMARGPFIVFTVIILIGAAVWIGSIHVAYPNQLALIWIGICIDLFGNGIILPLVRSAERLEKTAMAPMVRYLQFYPALNIEHKTERMNAFVTLVIGYSVVSLLYQSNASFGIDAFLGKAILGLVIAFCFSMLYFEVDSTNLYVHAIRRHGVAYAIWQNAHLPFILSFVLASGALAKLVVAHDCPNTSLDDLADSSVDDSVAEIDTGLRWFFCAGIGIALMNTAIISMAHDHRELMGLRFRKRYRLGFRILASVIVIVLPTAGDRLSSLYLLALVAGILVLSLFVELWGCSNREHGNFWADKTICKYSAECKLRKADMEALRKGEVTGIGQLVKRRRADAEKDDIIDIS